MDKTELVDLMLKDIEKMTKANEDALQYHNVRTILNYGDYNFEQNKQSQSCMTCRNTGETRMCLPSTLCPTRNGLM